MFPFLSTPRSSSGSGFHFRKWYLDVVAPDGSATIGYWARLSWGMLGVRYAALMTIPADPAHPVVEQVSLIYPPEPEEQEGEVAWEVPALGVSETWKPAGVGGCGGGTRDRAALTVAHPGTVHPAAVSRDLLGDGTVRWECKVPVAQVGVKGTGYAELLSLGVEPWKLPLNELRWGRVAHPELSAVWFEWKGPRPLCVVLVNGVEQPGAQVNDEGVRWQGGELAFTPHRTIRDMAFAEGPARHLPWVAAMLPPRLLGMHETLRLSTVTLPSGTRAFAIHQTVRMGSGEGGGSGAAVA